MGGWWWGAKADVSIAEELRLHSNSRRDPSAQYLLRRNLHNCAIVKYYCASSFHICTTVQLLSVGG